jgi:hypothetical protein
MRVDRCFDRQNMARLVHAGDPGGCLCSRAPGRCLVPENARKGESTRSAPGLCVYMRRTFQAPSASDRSTTSREQLVRPLQRVSGRVVLGDCARGHWDCIRGHWDCPPHRTE